MTDDDEIEFVIPEDVAPAVNPGGRPRSLVADEKTLKRLESLGGLQCTYAEAAAALGVARRTLQYFFGRHPEAVEALERGRELGKLSMRRAQFKMGLENVQMSIWWGKNYMGQTDKMETTTTVTTLTPEERIKRITEIQKQIATGKDEPK